MESSTQSLITALRLLVNDVQSEDGVASAVIAEAAERLERLQFQRNLATGLCASLEKHGQSDGPSHSKYYFEALNQFHQLLEVVRHERQ